MARLTEQEQQEIIRFIEADRPLPDKYRFLLFEEKREVELVWNGKTGEVCSTVLPFQTIEHVDEPRAEKSEDSPLQADPGGCKLPCTICAYRGDADSRGSGEAEKNRNRFSYQLAGIGVRHSHHGTLHVPA